MVTMPLFGGTDNNNNNNNSNNHSVDNGSRSRIQKRIVRCMVLRLGDGARRAHHQSTTTTTSTGGMDDAGATSASTPVPAPLLIEQQQQQQRTVCIHGVTSRDMALNEAVARMAHLDSLQEANELIDLGAVWARMEPLQPQDLLRQYDNNNNNNDGSSSSSRTVRLDDDGKDDFAANSRVTYADLAAGMSQQPLSTGRPKSPSNPSSSSSTTDLDEYIEQMNQQRYRRILSPGWIEAGTDLRIYRYPRRFTQACEQMTPDRILYQDTTFVVVDKPPMLPVQPEASNYQECCPGCVQEHSGPFFNIQGEAIVRPLICHRVDTCVGGCVVLAKDQHGQKVFATLQRDRQIRKLYLAISATPVPLGRHVHWMWDYGGDSAAAKPPCQLIRHTPPESRRKAREYWDRCVLEVVSCEPVHVPASVLSSMDPDRIADPSESNNIDVANEEVIQLYESTIRLVTGRKHQVRAQLAGLGSPIWGDTLYGPMSGLTLDDDDVMEDNGRLATTLAQCRVPTAPIGLQAHAIMFGGIRAKASPPWWKWSPQTATNSQH